MSTDLGYLACGQLPTDGDHEFRCECCRARCTQSPTKPDIEYGHLSGCPNRPDEFPDYGRQYRPAAEPHHKLVADGGDDTDDDAHARRIAEQLAMADDEETEGGE